MRDWFKEERMLICLQGRPSVMLGLFPRKYNPQIYEVGLMVNGSIVLAPGSGQGFYSEILESLLSY